jgi:IS605 OrfB family transposase
MLLTAHLKMVPTEEQHALLLETMECFNTACNKVSSIAFQENNFDRVALQKQCYYGVREEFGLSSQMTILATRKVADSYRIDIENIRIRNMSRPEDAPKEQMKQHRFKKHGGIQYDVRCLSWKGRDRVSILTLNGRIEVPLVLSGNDNDAILLNVQGQCDLVYRKKKFYLAVCYEAPEECQYDPAGFIGVDLGRKNIASTSDGDSFCGEACERTRKHYVELRGRYQSVGTKSAHKHLAKLVRKEYNFKSNENHSISKKLVAQAKGTGRGIALENLTHIPSQKTAKGARDAASKWAFRQLRTFIEYKAKLSGVPIVLVDPAYTSQCCSVCGFINKGNRKSQSEFVCLECGHKENADVNAAKNIQARAAVNQPMVVRHAAEA